MGRPVIVVVSPARCPASVVEANSVVQHETNAFLIGGHGLPSFPCKFGPHRGAPVFSYPPSYVAATIDAAAAKFLLRRHVQRRQPFWFAVNSGPTPVVFTSLRGVSVRTLRSSQ